MKLKDSALVLLSGGQDSTTCLYWALSKFSTVHALCFTYGQRHSLEVEVARRNAERAGVSFRLLDTSIIGEISSNSLTSDIEMDTEAPEGSFPNTFVPGRNMFFLTFAAVVARNSGIKHLIAGVSEADYSGYPDCRDTFIYSLNATLNLSMDEHFKIHTPLMNLNKMETWALADKLGVFDIVKNNTLTCYNGVMADGCGECPSCKLRKKGLEEYLKIRGQK